VTPCSNLTNTKPVRAGCATTAGNQVESHTHTVEPRGILGVLTSGVTPTARLPPCGIVKLRKLLLKPRKFGHIIYDYVEVARVSGKKVLIVFFGRIKALERNYFRDDRLRKYFGLFELTYVGLRDFLLTLIRIEDG